MNKLYSTIGSGNCYKAQLVMAQLGIPYETVQIDVLKGESREPDYLAINPNGTVPFLRLNDGRCLAESNAMLWMLADRSALSPKHAYEQALAIQWMIFEQTSLEPNISPARFFTSIVPSRRKEMEAEIDGWQAKGNEGLERLNKHLAESEFVAGSDYTIADIAVYGYTHVAHEGGFDMDRFPAVQSWIRRISTTRNYVPMNEISMAA
jgi:glutathione S-transferase